MAAENPFSVRRLLFVILLLVSTCVSFAVCSSGVKKDVNTDCQAHKTCRSCTTLTRCSWSLERQSCVDTERISGNLVVRLEAHCPRFAVVQKSAIGESYGHRIKVTNDLKGFTTFLRGTEIQCRFGMFAVPGRVDGNDVIACEAARRGTLQRVGGTAEGPIFHCHVTFANGTILRLDDDSDYYFSFFDRDRDCDGVNGTDHECLACTWSADNVVRHLRRCSAENRCTGPVEWYDARDVRDFSPVPDDGGGVGDNGTAEALAVRVACPEAAVESVEPLWAPWAGGVTVRIAVRNHRILAENRSVTVTLAGRYCAYPMTVRRSPAGDAIACTVSPTARTDEPAEGPVVVVYSGGEGHRSFAVASTQIFQFVVPEVLDVNPRCGPLEGGTEVTLLGRHLNAGSTVRVSLGDNSTCEPVERLENRIRCVTSAAGGGAPVSGAVSVMFDKSLVRPAAGGQRFTYTGAPRLATRQRLAGIASGGTAVLVRGQAFACVHNASFYVHDRAEGRRWYSTVGCRVLSDELMACRSPELINASLSAVVADADAAVATMDEVAADARSQPRDAPTPLVFGVLAYVAGHEHDLRSPEPLYDAFPDPVFDSFEIVNGSVEIAAAAGGYRGYHASDVRVRFPSRTDARCAVTEVAHGRIVCTSSAPDVVHKLRAIVVTVGDKYVSVVNWKTGTYDGYKVFSALSGSVLLTGIVLLCVRTLRQANLGGGRRTPLFEMKVGAVTAAADKRAAPADTYSVLTCAPEKITSTAQ